MWLIFEIGLDSVTCILPAHPQHIIIREIQEIQDKIILGKLDEAKEQVLHLLKTDLYNFRTLDLYCEILGKQKNAQELFDFLTGEKIDYTIVNADTLLSMVEILTMTEDNESYRELAKGILSIALNGKIEESQIEKAVINLKRMGEPEKVIRFIDDIMDSHPHFLSNSKLLEKRATSKMDLAKKCIETARDMKSSSKTKARAWDMCRGFLDEAEKDLKDALNNADTSNEKFYIEEHDMRFLEKMKEISKKPDLNKRFHKHKK